MINFLIGATAFIFLVAFVAFAEYALVYSAM
jgi:hypothetical protein